METEDYELIQKTYRFLVENPDRWIKGNTIDNDENVCAVGALRLCSGDTIISEYIYDDYEQKCFSGEDKISNGIWGILNIEAAKRGYDYITKANDSGGYEVVLSIFETVLSENAPKVGPFDHEWAASDALTAKVEKLLASPETIPSKRF